MAGRVRVPLVVVLCFTLQRSVLSGLHVHRAQPDLMVLVVVLAGLLGGAQRGAVVGFGVGVLVDLFLASPFGLSALTYTVVGFLAGAARAGVLEAPWWLVPLGAAGGSAIGVVIFALLEAIVGRPGVLGYQLAWVVAVVAAANLVLALPAARAMAWAIDAGSSRPSVGSRRRASTPAAGAGRWGLGPGR